MFEVFRFREARREPLPADRVGKACRTLPPAIDFARREYACLGKQDDDAVAVFHQATGRRHFLKSRSREYLGLGELFG